MKHGSLVIDALDAAGVDINVPCGGQGRCGRCAVVVESGNARRRSTLRLSAADIEAGYALACQTVVEGDLEVVVPPQEEITRHLTTEKTAAKVSLPFEYDWRTHQTVAKYYVELEPPSLTDNTDDLARLERELSKQFNARDLYAPLPVLRTLAQSLRRADWRVTAVIDRSSDRPRLVDVLEGDRSSSLYGAAVDIGTTTVTVYLVDLLTGDVVETAADYNGQIKRGEDVISRIVYASKSGTGLVELQSLVTATINKLVDRCARRRKIEPTEIYKMAIVGNSTMMHILLGLPPEQIRLTPYITTVNHPPTILANELNLNIQPMAPVDPLPGVASFMGADITAGVLSSGTHATDQVTLFLDIGTNGEMVFGNREWLVSCACSAGPAFEGAGVMHGMRATTGAIEEVWINAKTYEPTIRVIGGGKPRGLCGSGLISLIAEMFITGVTDKAGSINLNLPSPRVRQGEHGPEYVISWAADTDTGKDIVITKPDVDNLLRAKAAIYAGYIVLAQSVGMSMNDVEQMLIGGSFGQYLNIEKAIEIGLLPDLPWDRFKFLGNTAARGAYMALLRRDAREEICEIAKKMTYLELAADNAFTDQFMAALFLPHTDMTQFPSVQKILDEEPVEG
ncbi:MAG: ASKHA domain-containing protein [Chloroflexi bacterium]|nr:ASKHA domain-containing protein [Chloroflexota bacterium]